MIPGMGLTILGIAGVGLSFAGIARTFLEGMHAIAALMMFIGMILLATGILKDGLPSSNTAKATVIILIGFLVTFGTFMIGMSQVGSLSIFAGILLLILIPSIVTAYAAHKQSTHFKAIALLFSSASAVGVIAFATFGMIAPQPIEAGVLEQPEVPAEVTERGTAGVTVVEPEPAMKAEVTILKGSAMPQNKAFDPAEISVEKGTLIVWTNNDDTLHTVTSGVADDPDRWSKMFDSGFLNEGEIYKLNTSKLEPGEYPYLCTLHPFMIGKVIVTE